MARMLVKLAIAHDLTEQVGQEHVLDAVLMTEQGQVVLVLPCDKPIPGKAAGDAWQGANGKRGTFAADVCAESGFRGPWLVVDGDTEVCVEWTLRRRKRGAAGPKPATTRRGLVGA